MITELFKERDISSNCIKNWTCDYYSWPRALSDAECDAFFKGGPRFWKLRLEAWLWMKLKIRWK